jgi:hypothetical protein
MKRIISIFLAVILMLVLTTVGYAEHRSRADWFKEFDNDRFISGAELAKWPEDEWLEYERARTAWANRKLDSLMDSVGRDDKEKLAKLTETYGFTIRAGGADGYIPKGAQPSVHLPAVEGALSRLGSVFTKKLVSAYKSGDGLIAVDTEFYLVINALSDELSRQPDGKVSRGAPFMAQGGKMTLPGTNTYPVRMYEALHEFGHALNYVMYSNTKYGAPFENETYRGAGGGINQASEFPSRFASSYAQGSREEDYAETFRAAVEGGTDKPLQQKSSTAIYKKTKIVYDDVVRLAGEKSRGAQRIAGYLGLAVE